MTDALARDALVESQRVSADGRPSLEEGVTPVFAVFPDESKATDFLGPVTLRNLARFPARIFADLLPEERVAPVREDAPLETVLERIDGTTAAVAVVDSSDRYVGVVTRESALLALLHIERERTRSLETRLRAAEARLGEGTLQGGPPSSERVERVGSLAGRLAHEINNPLACILANLAYVRERAGEHDGDPEFDQALESARGAAERVARIVKDLRRFSSEETGACAPTDLRRVVDLAVAETAEVLARSARLVKDYREVSAVLANEAELAHVFVNLLVNAAYAIPPGSDEVHEVHVGIDMDGETHVVVEVRDTGCGIPSDVLPRIFEPFFTTKPVGVGLGLGLSVCYGVVASLGGTLDVTSTPGCGSAFRVRLPMMPLVEVHRPRPAAEPSRRRGRVAVVDDEPAIRAAVARVLRTAHDVTLFVTGQELLAALAAGTRFEVIVCDLMMPEMTGMEVFARVREHATDQADRMVFLTGGAFTPDARAFLRSVANPIIEKPFVLEALRALVQRVTAASTAAD